EPQLSFDSMDSKPSKAQRGPPGLRCHSRHVEKLNRFLQTVEADNARLRGEVLIRRLEVS
ncbi:unnamed protein product, partial [Effrenium voratum]